MEPSPGNDIRLDSLSVEALADLVLRRDQYPLRPAAMRRLADCMRQEPERLVILSEALRDLDPSARRRAAQALGCCGPAARGVVDELCRSLETDPLWTVREAAAQALGAICWPLAELDSADRVPRQLLASALDDGEPLVRDAAICGLSACLADPHVAEAVKSKLWEGLESGMAHPHASRRCRSVTALCRLAAEKSAVVPAIAAGLSDSHWKVRRTTAQRLAETPGLVFSEAGYRQVLPALMKRQFDQHPIVQAAVQDALNRLEAICLDEQTGAILRLMTGKASAAETLLPLLRSAALPEPVQVEFRSMCRRRMDWHHQNAPRSFPLAEDAGNSLEALAVRTLDLAAEWMASPKQLARDCQSARSAAREKEAGWLLARLAETYFANFGQNPGTR